MDPFYHENPELIYEYDENGRRHLVRSRESNHRAHMRFTNKTKRYVDIWWRDYRGVKRFYAKVKPGTFYDVDSYVTHPWEFSDSSTKEPYVINNKTIYRPPKNIGGMPYRTNWNITIQVRSLRHTALLALAHLLPDAATAHCLELPKILAQELAETFTSLSLPPGQSRA